MKKFNCSILTLFITVNFIYSQEKIEGIKQLNRFIEVSDEIVSQNYKIDKKFCISGVNSLIEIDEIYKKLPLVLNHIDKEKLEITKNYVFLCRIKKNNENWIGFEDKLNQIDRNNSVFGLLEHRNTEQNLENLLRLGSIEPNKLDKLDLKYQKLLQIKISGIEQIEDFKNITEEIIKLNYKINNKTCIKGIENLANMSETFEKASIVINQFDINKIETVKDYVYLCKLLIKDNSSEEFNKIFRNSNPFGLMDHQKHYRQTMIDGGSEISNINIWLKKNYYTFKNPNSIEQNTTSSLALSSINDSKLIKQIETILNKKQNDIYLYTTNKKQITGITEIEKFDNIINKIGNNKNKVERQTCRQSILALNEINNIYKNVPSIISEFELNDIELVKNYVKLCNVKKYINGSLGVQDELNQINVNTSIFGLKNNFNIDRNSVELNEKENLNTPKTYDLNNSNRYYESNRISNIEINNKYFEFETLCTKEKENSINQFNPNVKFIYDYLNQPEIELFFIDKYNKSMPGKKLSTAYRQFDNDSLIVFFNKNNQNYGYILKDKTKQVDYIKLTNIDFEIFKKDYTFFSTLKKLIIEKKWKTAKAIRDIIQDYRSEVLIIDKKIFINKLTGINEDYQNLKNELAQIQKVKKDLIEKHYIEIDKNFFYFGEKKDGKQNGFGNIYYKDKISRKLVFSARWKNGFPIELGQISPYNDLLFLNSPNLNISNNDIELIINEKGLYYYKKSKNNINNKNGIECYNNGDIYSGELLNGLRHGKGIYIYNNGDKYNGEFKDGELTGYATKKYNNGKIIEGIFINGSITKTKETIEQEQLISKIESEKKEETIQSENKLIENSKKTNPYEEIGAKYAQNILDDIAKEKADLKRKGVPKHSVCKCGKKFITMNGWYCDGDFEKAYDVKEYEAKNSSFMFGNNTLSSLIQKGFHVDFPKYCGIKCAKLYGRCY